jgi:hypothetical protein
VEDIIEQEVRAVLENSPPSLHNRIILVGKLIDALESDAGWVELYGITGELIVPITQDKDDEIGELLEKVKKVRITDDCLISMFNHNLEIGRPQASKSSCRKVERDSNTC